MTTRAQVAKFLAGPEGATELIVFEFSGAMLMQRLTDGVKAMGVDKRAPEHQGPCYQGDYRDVIDLKTWDCVYFIGPSCFQNMRHDHYLPAKIADFRAWWGVCGVAKCIACPYMRSAIIEQPDTVAHDYIDVSSMPGVSVLNTRTSAFGDKRDKFLRLTFVNKERPDVGWCSPFDKNKGSRPSMREYRNADERDRARSTWIDLKHTVAKLAKLRTIDPQWQPTIRYEELIEQVRCKWEAAGHRVPIDYNNPSGLPTSTEERAYQETRGAGDGLKRIPAPLYDAGARRPTTIATRLRARRAEAGDQVIKSSGAAAFLKMIDRKTEKGEPWSPAVEDHLLKLEGYNADDTEKMLFFWAAEHVNGEPEKACLSNYYQPAGFTEQGVVDEPVFFSVEQYMHYAKAALFKDVGAAQYLLSCVEPRLCRRKGREVAGFDDDQWTAVSRQVVERGIYLKFSQYARLARYLENTGYQYLIEASPYDARWGIGVCEDQAPPSDN